MNKNRWEIVQWVPLLFYLFIFFSFSTNQPKVVLSLHYTKQGIILTRILWDLLWVASKPVGIDVGLVILAT